MAGVIFPKRFFVLLIIASTLIITYLHYSTSLEAHALHGIYAELYYIPILLAALLGLKAAVLTYLFVSVLYLPFVFLSWINASLFLMDKLLHLLFTGIFALLAGLLVDRQKRYQKRLEKDKMELEKLDKLKSSFLANVSHELRTPMTAITGYAELLLDRVDGPLNEEQEKSMKKIVDHSKHLLRLINDILDVSKIETGEKISLHPRELILKDLIESVIPVFSSLLEKKGLSLTTHINKNLPPVFGDENKVKKILTNLLSNAVKFTQKGGITISARPSDREAKPGERPRFAEICVEDTGIGIKEEDIGKIFEKFMQVDFSPIRQYEGVGLGLSIVKALVKLHHGTVWVTSKEGLGSRFCFTLPVDKKVFEEGPIPSLEV
ncbi:MAG: HAMP domain-containing sensor histidine kinase [Nitrospirota bacterium]